MRREMRIHWIKAPQSRLLITGFKGIGQVGYLSIRYILDHLDHIKRIGIFESIYLPPVISVEEDYLSYPVEIYEFEDKFLLLKADELPVDSRGSYIIRKIIDELKSMEINKIISIGGLVSTLKEGEGDKVRVVYNSFWKEKLKYPYTQKNVKIYGPLANILFYTELKKIPAMALLAYADPEKPIDLRGVYNAIAACTEIIGIDIDLRELEETADELERKLGDILETDVKSDRDKYMYT